MVIGEFSSKSSNTDVGVMMRHAIDSGYSGAWDWAMVGGDTDGNDNEAKCIEAVHDLQNHTWISVDILGDMPKPKDTCSSTCTDIAPDSQYTCAQ
jgi:hypothetical protein